MPAYIKYIFHISDIHICNKTNENILFVFDQLVSDLKKYDNNEIIVLIAGDIFEYKNKCSPDDILTFKTIINKLENLEIYTGIIIGNHGFNSNNISKSTNTFLSSLLSMSSYKYINFYNKTGIYNYRNLDIYAFSPMDKKDIDISDTLDRKGYNNRYRRISLLHEPIKCKLYGSTQQKSARFSSSYLSDTFDISVLGDIHIPSFLHDNVGFCGSFVQKNKGEGLDHGYILWDVISRTGKFVKLKLKNAALIFSLKNNNENIKLPSVEANYIAIKYKNCTSDFIDMIQNTIVTKYNRQIDSIKCADVINFNSYPLYNFSSGETLGESPDAKKAITDNLSNYTDLFTTQSLKEYMDHVNIEPEISDEILKLYDKTIITRTQYTWSLNYLAWSNVYCYGDKSNYINFKNIDSGLTMICGANKTGKSSIIDILILVLFNKHIRGSSIDILNKHTSNNIVKLSCSFSVNNREYIIDRKIKCCDRKNITLSHGLFYKKQDSKFYVNVTKSSIVETYKYMSTLIGSCSDFLQGTCAIQERKSLSNMTGLNRMKYFYNYLNIEFLNDIRVENCSLLRTYKQMLSSEQENFDLGINTFLNDQKNKITEHINDSKKLSKVLLPMVDKSFNYLTIVDKSDNTPSLDAKIFYRKMIKKINKIKKKYQGKIDKIDIDINELYSKYSRTTKPEDKLRHNLSNLLLQKKNILDKLNVADTELNIIETLDIDIDEMDNIKNIIFKERSLMNNYSKIAKLEEIIKRIIDLKNNKKHTLNLIIIDNYDSYLDKIKNGQINPADYENVNVSNKQTKTLKKLFDKYQRDGLFDLNRSFYENKNNIVKRKKEIESILNKRHSLKKTLFKQQEKCINNQLIISRQIDNLKLEHKEMTIEYNNQQTKKHNKEEKNLRSEIKTLRSKLDNSIFSNNKYYLSNQRLSSDQYSELNYIKFYINHIIAYINTSNNRIDDRSDDGSDDDSDNDHDNDSNIKYILNSIPDKYADRKITVANYIEYANLITYLIENDRLDLLINTTIITNNDKKILLTKIKKLELEKKTLLDRIEKNRNTEIRINDGITILNTELDDIEKYEQFIKDITMHDIKKILNDSTERADKMIELKQQEIDNIKNMNSLSKINKEMKTINSDLKKIKNMTIIEENIEKCKSEKKKYLDYIILYDSISKMIVDTSHSTIERFNSYLKNKLKTRAINKKIKILDTYNDVLNMETGHPSKVIEMVCTLITNECNKILNEISDFSIKFIPKDKKMHMTIIQNNKQISTALGSGFQKFIIDMTIRIVFFKISQVPKADMLIIDEGFGCLDNHNRDIIFSYLNKIKTHFSLLLVITHIDELKNINDTIINVNNTSGFSTVNHGNEIKIKEALQHIMKENKESIMEQKKINSDIKKQSTKPTEEKNDKENIPLEYIEFMSDIITGDQLKDKKQLSLSKGFKCLVCDKAKIYKSCGYKNKNILSHLSRKKHLNNLKKYNIIKSVGI